MTQNCRYEKKLHRQTAHMTYHFRFFLWFAGTSTSRLGFHSWRNHDNMLRLQTPQAFPWHTVKTSVGPMCTSDIKHRQNRSLLEHWRIGVSNSPMSMLAKINTINYTRIGLTLGQSSLTIFSLTLPWLLVKCLTFPWQLSKFGKIGAFWNTGESASAIRRCRCWQK